MTLSAAVLDAAVALPPWREGRGARRIAVHAPDEDSLTLAWQAGRTLLDRGPETRIAALSLATTTAPVTDGGNASVLAEALRLNTTDLLVQEYGGGLFASGAALAGAAALVRAGVAPVLVVLSDTRPAGRGTGALRGSGAAALLVTAEGPVDFRITGAEADRADGAHALGDGLVEADPGFTRWLAARGARTPDEGGARTVGVTTGSRGLPGIGHLGCAAAWAETAAAVAGGPDGRAVRLELGGGGRYTIRFDFAPGWRPHPGSGGPDGRPDAPPPPPTPDTADFTPYTSAPQAWRDSREELRLIGARCPRCEAPQYPAAPACPVHGLGAETVPHEMALTGRVLTRTRDHVFPVGGPLTTAVVELADGGRFYGQVAAGHDVAIGDAVELVLRRIATAQGTAPRYFWKILPTTEGGR